MINHCIVYKIAIEFLWVLWWICIHSLYLRYSTTNATLEALRNVRFVYGSMNAGKALRVLREDMFTVEHGDRPEVSNVAIILSGR